MEDEFEQNDERSGAARYFIKINPRLLHELVCASTRTEVRLIAHILMFMSLRTNRIDVTHEEMGEAVGFSTRAVTKAFVGFQRGPGNDRGKSFIAKVGHGRYIVNPDYAHVGDRDRYLSMRFNFREAQDRSRMAPERREARMQGASVSFLKAHRYLLTGTIAALGGRRCRVFTYVLANMDTFDNRFRATQRKIMADTKVSYTTLIEAMRYLRGADYNYAVMPKNSIPQSEHLLAMVEDGDYIVNPSYAYAGTLRRYDLIREQYMSVVVTNNINR